MLQRSLTQQRGNTVVHLLPNKRHTSLAVLYIVSEFLSHIHRIEWHNSGIGAQDRVVCDHELRTVLHIQKNAIPSTNAQLGQIASKPVDFFCQSAVRNL